MKETRLQYSPLTDVWGQAHTSATPAGPLLVWEASTIGPLQYEYQQSPAHVGMWLWPCLVEIHVNTVAILTTNLEY